MSARLDAGWYRVTPQKEPVDEAVGNGEGGRCRCPSRNLARRGRPSEFWRSGSRTRQDRRPEQPTCQWSANLRPRDSRVRRLVPFGAPPRVQPHRRAPVPDSARTTQIAPATINLRLAAIRRIADEVADAGLLSPELAAGIRRVKGVRRIGVRLGNWLTPEQGRRLLESATPLTARELRDQAMVAMLIGAACAAPSCWP